MNSLTRLRVQANTESAQCCYINTKHNKVRVTEVNEQYNVQGLSGKFQ